ncbi:MAG: hypothetical protein PHP82_04260 [Candidatus ainarchaeum sp.]|nr:hypothetical protein [Candidatus ainarchaeum sp.]
MMKIMKKTIEIQDNKIQKKIVKNLLTLLIIFFLIGSINAEIFVNTSFDKKTISNNEVAFLTINLYNDSNDITNYPIRIETSENLVIIENEKQIYFETIDKLKEGIIKEIKVKVKAINTEETIGKAFVYYGDNLQFVSGTFVEIKEIPIIVKTNITKKNANEGEKIIIEFEIQNNYEEPIYNIGVETIPPNGFIVRTEPLFIPILQDGNKIKQEFELLTPLEVSGEHKFILSYGFFEKENIHYFEESFELSFEKRNNLLLIAIGVIILVIATFFYINKDKKDNEIKGTGEK